MKNLFIQMLVGRYLKCFAMSVAFIFFSNSLILAQSESSLFENLDQIPSSDKISLDRMLEFTAKHRNVNREESLDYLERIKVTAIRTENGKALVEYTSQRLEIALESSCLLYTSDAADE